MSGATWTEEDLQVVRDNPLMNARVLGEKLGRTAEAIYHARDRLKNPRRVTHLDYDERPAGWYGEVIGTLLMQYPDAYTSWKHFHRYVEVKEIESALPGGWTQLLCRRDPEAP